MKEKNTYKLTYFDIDNNYCGTIHKMREIGDINDLMKNSEEVLKDIQRPSKIFWNINGYRGKIVSSSHPYYVIFSNELNKIIVIAIEGVFSIQPKDKSINWIWKEDQTLFQNAYAKNYGLNRFVFVCHNPDGYFLLALDIKEARATKFKVSEPKYFYREMNVKQSTLVPDGNNLIRIDFKEDGEAVFSTQKLEVKETIAGTYNGIFILETDNDNKTELLFDNFIIPLGEQVMYVYPSESYIWAITISQKIYRIDPRSGKSDVMRFDLDKIIDAGSAKGRVWIADRKGKVVFGDKEIKMLQIELPSF